jgi:hypothetical protein
MPKTFAELHADLKAHPMDVGVMENVITDLLDQDPPLYAGDIEELTRDLESIRGVGRNSPILLSGTYAYLLDITKERAAGNAFAEYDLEGGRRRRKSQTKRFGSCVKAVRKTVKARKGSNPESAAIAICTTTLLHPRGRTLKRYRKGRLLTQKRLRNS